MRLIKHPVLCNYYVTYRCNASCDFCDIWEKPSPYIKREDVKQNLIHLKQLGVKIIDFTGGEPLLHREIDLFLKEAKNLGFITTLTTNTLLYPKWAHKIKGLVDMLHFSLDYYDAKVHDEIRGVKCYDSVIESIKLAKSLNEKPDILMTVFDENIKDIDLIHKKIALPNDLMLLLNPVFDYNNIENHGGISPEGLTEISKWGKKKNIYLNQAFISLRQKGGNDTKKPICKAASSTIVISPENKLIAPCYHLTEDETLIENNLDKLFHSDTHNEWKNKEGKLSKCEGCAINCYMQPSFAVELNKYWFQAIPSTIKYNIKKGSWKSLFRLKN